MIKTTINTLESFQKTFKIPVIISLVPLLCTCMMMFVGVFGWLFKSSSLVASSSMSFYLLLVTGIPFGTLVSLDTNLQAHITKLKKELA
jgi:magnesium-transporting ATPase (P-type)